MNPNRQNKIAILDIDGTLIKGQVQQGLINYLYSRGELSFYYVMKLNIWFILYKLHILSNVSKIFKFGINYFVGQSTNKIDQMIDEYVKLNVKPKIFPGSVALLNRLRSEGYTIIILSTAVDAIVVKLAKLFDIDQYICTRLEVINGLYTGNIVGDIAYGNSKTELLQKYLVAKKYSALDVEAYADHESDISMLKIVGKAYIANPDKKMKRLSLKNNFDTIDLRKS